MSLSRSQIPPGGWQFYQPQTKWSPPTPISSTFDQTVTLIIQHRQANGAVSVRDKLAMDRASVETELENYTRLRLNMPAIGADASPKTNPRRPLPQVVAEAAVGVRKVAEGAAPLIEWLASGGKAVAPELSEARASICATCPKNQSGDFTKWFTIPVSNLIRSELSKRSDLKLATSNDDKLGVCEACYCPMKLKVHTPLDIILKHLKPETKAALDPRCWMLKETPAAAPYNAVDHSPDKMYSDGP